MIRTYMYKWYYKYRIENKWYNGNIPWPETFFYYSTMSMLHKIILLLMVLLYHIVNFTFSRMQIRIHVEKG